jgi:hypothetical protein
MPDALNEVASGPNFVSEFRAHSPLNARFDSLSAKQEKATLL